MDINREGLGQALARALGRVPVELAVLEVTTLPAVSLDNSNDMCG
jgi:hypothetical protein